jgi:xanthine dehydrogenase accessory factor
LGRVLEEGEAEADTGMPAEIDGCTWERVLRSPGEGPFHAVKKIGDPVAAGDTVGWVGELPLKSQIPGVLRGLIREGFAVYNRMKLGDIDPRNCRDACFTISDKARSIGGGVLEAILVKFNVH